MKKQYDALVLTSEKETVIEKREARALKPDEVRVRLSAAGICGTDMHYYDDFANAGFKLQNPIVLGHEASGVVVELGEGVTDLKIDDKVAVTPVMNCGKCDACREGNANICTNKQFPGSATTIPHVDGFFREYFEIDARCCRKLSDSAKLENIAFVEPAACALHAVESAGNLIGRRVLITGAGPIGTLAGAMAKQNGAVTVVVTDIADESLAIAEKMGADKGLNIMKQSIESYVEKEGAFDVAIEASGAISAYISCLNTVKKRGTVVQVSVLAEKEPQIPANLIMVKELTLKGSYQFNGEFDRALGLISQGMLDVTPMLTTQFTFDEADQAFELAKNRRESMKVQFIPS